MAASGAARALRTGGARGGVAALHARVSQTRSRCSTRALTLARGRANSTSKCALTGLSLGRSAACVWASRPPPDPPYSVGQTSRGRGSGRLTGAAVAPRGPTRAQPCVLYSDDALLLCAWRCRYIM